jgi:hypothetical protein
VITPPQEGKNTLAIRFTNFSKKIIKNLVFYVSKILDRELGQFGDARDCHGV